MLFQFRRLPGGKMPVTPVKIESQLIDKNYCADEQGIKNLRITMNNKELSTRNLYLWPNKILLLIAQPSQHHSEVNMPNDYSIEISRTRV